MIVARVGGDCDDHVDTGGQFSKAKIFHGSGSDQGFLRIVEDMSEGVHSHVIVGDVNSHGLLTHSTLVRVSGRLKRIERREVSKIHF